MEKVILEYEILKSDDIGLLALSVNNMIKNGWQPFGSMSSYIRQKEGLVFHLQPVVKYGVNRKKRRTVVTPK